MWVDEKIKERKDAMVQVGNGGIQMDAETYARFQAWEQISSKCSQVADCMCDRHQRERRPPLACGDETEADQSAARGAAVVRADEGGAGQASRAAEPRSKRSHPSF